MSAEKLVNDARMQENIGYTKDYVDNRVFKGSTSEVNAAITAGKIVNGTIVVVTDE